MAEGLRARHVLAASVGLLVAAWVAAHIWLVVFLAGGIIGYLSGRRGGRRRAILDAARTIVAERARELGRLPL